MADALPDEDWLRRAYLGGELAAIDWSSTIDQAHIALAVSSDGVTWQKAPRPLLSQTLTPGHWESGSFGRPILLRVGAGWRLYYTGVEDGEPSLGVALAAEGWQPW